jgi:hypothetical protein
MRTDSTEPGIKRVHVEAGATAQVHFSLDARDLSWVNPDGDRLVSAGTCHIHVGGGQTTGDVAGADADLVVEGEQKLPE